jgi:hypothetical protein
LGKIVKHFGKDNEKKKRVSNITTRLFKHILRQQFVWSFGIIYKSIISVKDIELYLRRLVLRRMRDAAAFFH